MQRLINLNPFNHFGQTSEQQQKESSGIKHGTERRGSGNKIQKMPPYSNQPETVPHSPWVFNITATSSLFQQVKWQYFHINVFYLKVRVTKRSDGWSMLLNNNLPNTELLLCEILHKNT